MITILMVFRVGAQIVTYRQYTVEDGLPSNTVYAITQDTRGNLWVGTDGGVSRWDGYSFTNYTLADGLPDLEILKFYKDSKGRIWMCTLNGKVGYIYKDSVYTTENQLPESLDFNAQIVSIVETKQGIIFSASDNPCKLLDSLGRVIYLETGPSLESGIHFVVTEDQVIRGIGRNHYVEGKDAFNLSQKVPRMPLGVPKNSYVEQSGDQILYKQFNGQVESYHYKTDSVSVWRQFSEAINSLSKQNGSIYISTGDGHYLYEQNQLTKLTDRPISSSYLDQDGNVWYATLTEGLFQEIVNPVSKMNTGIEDMTCFLSSESQISIATSKNDIYAINKGLSLTHRFSCPKEAPLLGAFTDHRQNEWVYSRNLALNNSHRMEIPYTYKAAFHSGFYFFATQLGVFRYPMDSFLLKKNNNYLSKYQHCTYHPFAKDFEVINADSLMVATNFGTWIYQVQGGQQKPRSYPVTNSRTVDVIKAPDGFWLATAGKGVMHHDGAKSIIIDKEKGLITNDTRKLLLVDSILWVATNQGLEKIVLGKEDTTIYHLSKEEGLPGKCILDIALMDERILVLTPEGIGFFHKNTDFEENNRIPLTIDNVFNNGQLISPSNTSPFTYKQNNLSVYYTGVSLRRSGLLYAYSLSSEQASPWIETISRRVDFLNLGPGQYSLKVKVKTKNSSWSEPVTYSFAILPPFWKTTWFFIAVLLFTSGLTGTVLYRTQRNSRIREKLLLDKVAAELKALRVQMNPHFIFNALNAVQRFVVKGEKDESRKYLSSYSQVIRSILDQSNKLIIPLAEELGFLDKYVQLEKLRLDYSFDYFVETDDKIDLYNTFIPSMLIQPSIENSIWHGLMPLEKKGTIRLSIKSTPKEIFVRIIDDGVGFDPAIPRKKEGHTSYGIKMMKERIQLLSTHYHQKIGFKIDSKPGEGTTTHFWFSNDLV